MEDISIKDKSITGAKWTIFISILVVPLTYLLHMLLGRVGPEVLGTYSSIQIFIQSINTFVLFGGLSVLANFIPKMRDKDKISNFLFSYIIIVVIISFCSVLLLCFFPSLIKYLFKENLTNTLLYFFMLFAPVVIIFQLIRNALYGLLEIKISSILARFQLFGLLVFITFFVLFSKQLFKNYYFPILLIVIFSLDIIGLTQGLRALFRRVNFKKDFHFYLPDGFWGFAFSIYVGTVCGYGFANIDKLFILKLGNLNQLGLYQAVISIWLLVDFFPQMLLRVLVPMFSSYIAIGNKESMRKSYLTIEKYCIFFSISVGLFIICFSRELLSFFGKEYTDNYFLLIILVAGSSFSTLQYVNGPLLISTEKNKERLINSILRIVIQLALSFFLVDKIGILGIVLARVSALLIGQIIPIYVVVKKLPYNIKIPREFLPGAVIVLLCSIVCYLLDIRTSFYSMVLFFASFSLFFMSARYNMYDLRFILNLVLRRKKVSV